jgi:hypothetical protein
MNGQKAPVGSGQLSGAGHFFLSRWLPSVYVIPARSTGPLAQGHSEIRRVDPALQRTSKRSGQRRGSLASLFARTLRLWRQMATDWRSLSCAERTRSLTIETSGDVGGRPFALATQPRRRNALTRTCRNECSWVRRKGCSRSGPGAEADRSVDCRLWSHLFEYELRVSNEASRFESRAPDSAELSITQDQRRPGCGAKRCYGDSDEEVPILRRGDPR